jgi:hypothetical protein
MTAAVALMVGLAGSTLPAAAETNFGPGGGGASVDAPGGSMAAPDRCEEGYARLNGHLGYLQARLQLTPEQQPLWDKWQQKLLASAQNERSSCAAERASMSSRPNALQREDAAVRMMTMRIETIKASRPELQALYTALTAAQQEVFDHLWPPMPPPRFGQRADGGRPGMGGQLPGAGQQPGAGQPPALPAQ